MDEYISSPEYKTSRRQNSGICVGIEHHQNPDQPNNYTFSLHYPDKPIGRSSYHWEMAIPDQNNQVWSPYSNSPDLESLYRY